MIGQTVSHYKIIEKLGEGGVGIVYKAFDERLERFVALKFLSPELTRDQEAKERFIQEAHAASSLDHANICNIHDIDSTGDGNLFICMTYYPGETLRSVIGRGPLEIPQVCDIACQIAEGLTKAHEHGIVHRDVKPGNIMISEDGVVKILDFGLAKLVGHAMITKDLSTRGTVAYMSPEQASGHPVDARTDVWSLGVVLFEMLTGLQPFQGEYDQALIYSILNEEPPQIAPVRDDLPPALQGIVERALRKKPEERYERMADMLEAIRACAHEGDLPRADHRIAVAPRGKRLAIIVSCAAAALIAAFALFRGHLLPSREGAITSLAVLPFKNLSTDTGQEYFSDGMTEAIIAELSKIKALRVISRTSVMRYRESDKSLSRIAQELGVEAIVEGSVQRAGDEVRITAQLVAAHPEKHIWANDFNRSLTNLLKLQSEVAEEIARQIRVAVTPEERNRIEIARAANPAAHDAYLKGRFLVEKNSYADILRGMSLLEQAIAIDSTYAPAYTGLAKGYDILGGLGYYPPKEAWTKVRALADKALRFDPNLYDAYLLIADADFVYDWDFKGAGLGFQRAITLNPNDATTRSWYATYLASMGRLNEAIIEAERSVALDPLSSVILVNYAWLLFVDGRYDSALVAARNVIVLEPAASLAHHVIAHVYTLQGKYEEAIRECQISLALGDSTVLYEIALSRAVAGRVAEAREALAELERIAKRTYVSPVEFARIYYTLGDKERAFSLLDEAYRNRATDLIHIKTEPYFEGLRRDPRFVALLKRIGFPS